MEIIVSQLGAPLTVSDALTPGVHQFSLQQFSQDNGCRSMNHAVDGLWTNLDSE